MRVIFFLKCSKFNVDLRNAEKNEKKYLVSQIKVSELVALILSITERILVNGSECVNKQS